MELNPIETILSQWTDHRGMSLRKLTKGTGMRKKTVKYYIYTSNFIENTTPYLHGSWKQKINVFNYTPVEKKYTKRNEKKKFSGNEIDEIKV